MKKVSKPKKRNPADTTMRNIKALQKKVKLLSESYAILSELHDGLVDELIQLGVFK